MSKSEDSALPSAAQLPSGVTHCVPPEPEAHSLIDILMRYQKSVEGLATAFTTNALLDVLLLRDAIERTLAGNVDNRYVTEILKTDKALGSLPRHIFHRVRKSLIEWRRSLMPPANAWWWFLDRALSPRLERIEATVLVSSVVLFPFSLGVAIELARLYGSDSSGVVSLLPIAATFLGSFSLGGVLSLSFRNGWTGVLEEIGFGPRLRFAITCFMFALLSVIVALWFTRPRFSKYYNDVGVSSLVTQRPRTQLSSAQTNLERAVRFDPTNPVAHYNLGRVYEDLLDDDRAITEYLIAFAAGLDLAGNNVGHLYLLRGQFDRAAFVLQRTFVLADPEAKRGDRDLRYVVLKNFGWARFGQSRFAEARRLLEEAIRIEPDRADAHCLLAKTLNAMNDRAAQNEWRSCLGLAWHDTNEPARETWLGEAKRVLERAQ